MGTIPKGIGRGKDRLAGEIRHLRGFLALPLSAVRTAGQAAQTLAGLLEILRQDGRSTFRKQELIGKAAGVPIRTLRRHLAELQAAGLIVANGRHDRRTVTYGLAATEAAVLADGFLPLPRFALELPWTQRVVYAWLVFRAEVSQDGATVEDSLRAIAAGLGITKRSVITALAKLQAAGLIQRDHHLHGENGRMRLLSPTTYLGGEKMADTCLGGEKMAAEGVKKWPPCGEKMAAAVSKEKIQEHGPRSVDHVCISVDEIQTTAGQVFRKAGYRGQDGRNLWKLAALLHLGRISEHDLWDACQGAAECRPANRPAYIYAIVANHLAKRGVDLQTELNQVRIQPAWPSGPPRKAVTGETDSREAAWCDNGPRSVSSVIDELRLSEGDTGGTKIAGKHP